MWVVWALINLHNSNKIYISLSSNKKLWKRMFQSSKLHYNVLGNGSYFVINALHEMPSFWICMVQGNLQNILKFHTTCNHARLPNEKISWIEITCIIFTEKQMIPVVICCFKTYDRWMITFRLFNFFAELAMRIIQLNLWGDKTGSTTHHWLS